MRLFAPNYSDKMFDIYQNQFGMFPLGDDTDTIWAKVKAIMGVGTEGVDKALSLQKALDAKSAEEVQKALGQGIIERSTNSLLGQVALYGTGAVVVLVLSGMILSKLTSRRRS